MPTLPSATTRIAAGSGASIASTDLLCVMGPVPTNADAVPRIFSSTSTLLEFHGYSAAADYAAMHFADTGKPVMFVGLPIETAGAISDIDNSGVTGTSDFALTGTPTDAADVVVEVTQGGTVGSNPIVVDVSLDGGRTFQPVRFGLDNSRAVPYSGLTLGLGAGTLVAGDTFTARVTGPMPDAAGIELAKDNLQAQLVSERSWLCVWEAQEADDADDVLSAVNAYETESERYVYARLAVRDRFGAHRKSDTGTLTFAEVGATGDTITRSAGSFVADGFKVGDLVTSTGTVSNNFSNALVTNVTATVLTLDTQDLVAEAAVAGSELTVAAESLTTWATDVIDEFSDVFGSRISLSAGSARKLSPLTQRRKRRPASWFASLREYSLPDIQLPTWRKADGPLLGVDLEDEDGAVVEYDERLMGMLIESGFTTLRSWGNGPRGAFVAMDLTRADPGSLLSRTHNAAVVFLAQKVCQAATEYAVGTLVQLRADGRGQERDLKALEDRVNSALAINLLSESRAGVPRASDARWLANRNDVLNVPGAILNGILSLTINGTIEHVATSIVVNQA